MYEFEIIIKGTDERRFIYDYSINDACRRSRLDRDTVVVLFADYID